MQLTAVQPVHFLGLRSMFDNAVRMFLFHIVLSLQQGGAVVARRSDLDVSRRTRHVAATIWDQSPRAGCFCGLTFFAVAPK